MISRLKLSTSFLVSLYFFGISIIQSINSAYSNVEHSNEIYLKIASEVICDVQQKHTKSNSSDHLLHPFFPGITGYFFFQNKHFRFELIEGKPITEVFIGSLKSDSEINNLSTSELRLNQPLPTLYFNQNKYCKIKENSFTKTIEYLHDSQQNENESLALTYFPVLVIRGDQYKNRSTDLPLLQSYSVLNTKNFRKKIIKYHFYFSDEDSMTSVKKTDGQLTRYGRREDIEWSYEVHLKKNLNHYEVESEYIQSGQFLGIGHRKKKLKKNPFLIPGTKHPILYNALFLNIRSLKHNIFSERPTHFKQKSNPIIHSLIPRDELSFPMAREELIFKNPWILKVTDDELFRERKISFPTNQYLYIEIERKEPLIGKISKPFIPLVRWEDGTLTYAGSGRSTIDRFGEDLFWKKTFTAVHLNDEVLQKIFKGEQIKAELEINTIEKLNLRFYLLQSKNTEEKLPIFKEISHQFRCNLDRIEKTNEHPHILCSF